jgi:hypothetical protein
LYRRVRGGQEPILLQGVPGDGHASLQVALTQFRHALDALESTWQALHAVASELVETGESAQVDGPP